MIKATQLFIGMSILFCTANAQNTFPTSGNVGINTTSPQEHLHVNGNQLLSGGFLKFNNNSNDANDGKIANSQFAEGLNIVGINNNNTYRKIHLWGEITQQQNDGINTFKATTSFENMVGIGTTTPGCRLHVAEGNIASSFGSLSGFVQLWGDNSIMWKQGSSYQGLRFGSATGLSAENYSEKMIIKDDGKIGIGTSNPIGKLQVDIDNTDYHNTNGANSGLVLNNTNTDGQTALTYIMNGNVTSKLRSDYVGNLNWVAYSGSHYYYTGGDFGTGRIRMVINNNGSFSFGNNIINGDIGTGSALFINSAGYVGIGTTNPGIYKLAVDGDVAVRKIRVTQGSGGTWPDYVFEPSYKLPTLESTEAFVNQHKHLPEVPSAQQVKDEGIDLGENQAALLKKIEELTLYVIDLNKKVQKLISDNTKQETTIQKLLAEK